MRKLGDCGGRAVLLGLLLASVGGGPLAQSEEDPPIPYELLAGSTYQHGCWEPCECPLLEPVPLEGGFGLKFLPTAGPIETKGVVDVEWFVPVLDKQITGGGIFQLLGDQQLMALELQIDGAPAEMFDSGFLPGGDQFPLIDVVLTMNDFYCYDVVMRVLAAPVEPQLLTLAVDHSLLTWSGPAQVQSFDVVTGSLMLLAANGGDFTGATENCLADDHPASSLDCSISPAENDGLWFLVRGNDVPTVATYDSGGPAQVGTRDAEIGAAPAACP